jgi:hypothetical protein
MIRFLFCFVIVLQLITFAQNTKIEVIENCFYISLKDYKPKFIDTVAGNFILRDYYEYTNPSKKTTYKLPFIVIYLAIPQNAKVTVSDLEFESKFEEKTIPKLNPQVLNKDSVIKYIEKDYLEATGNEIRESVVQIENYFWFREFYIVQIKVNNYRFRSDQSKIEVLLSTRFRINLSPQFIISPQSPIKIQSDYDEAVKRLITNSETAEQFRNNSTFSLLDTTGDWIDYNATYLKIGAGNDAIFRITKTDLEAFGINTNSIDPRTFKMIESGRQIKLFVKGENDGVFDDTDFIESWGHKNYPNLSNRVINDDDKEYNEYLNRYTDTTFYFLTWNGDNGDRIDSLELPLAGINDTLDYNSQLLHFETQSYVQLNDNNEVANQTANWLKNKTWYWKFLFSQRTFNFNLTDIYPGKNASIYTKLVSFASDYPSNSHQVKLLLNNALIDSNSIDRFEQLLLLGNINSSSLISGSNQIKLENIPNGSSPNSLAVDWYEVEYPRNLKLIDDSLYFKVPDDINNGLKIIKAGDANSSEYNIYKIKPEFRIFTNYTITDSTLFFADTVSAGDEYFILSANKSYSPKFVEVKNFINLRNYSQQTDYISITHPVFLSSAQSYVQSISSLFNLATSVFKVDDIFDEFSYGYSYPEGIRLFLNVLYNNLPQPKPTYLALLGDANYDYKYYRDPIAGLNYVPSFGFPVGDNWFAIWDLSGVPIPQLKVGRIPFDDPDQLEYYLSKIESNESKPFDEWNKRYLFFSGGVEDNELEILKATNDTLINRLISPRPVAGNYTHFYKTISPRTDFGPYTAEEIEAAISAGSLFISYIGHSGTATWDNSINETNQLYNNVDRNPLITDFGCSTNKYAEPDIVCFGERFLFNSTGQALAYVGNSSLGFRSTATAAPVFFYENLISDSLSEIGNAHLFSKIDLFSQFGNSGVNRIYSLSNVILGDPAVRIKIPKLPNFKISTSDVILGRELITDNLDSIEIKIAINNLGLAETGEFEINIIHEYNSSEIKNILLSVPIPAYSDTLSLWVLTKDKPGIHNLNINIDPDDLINEIYKDDNYLSFQFNVFSSSLRDFLTSRVENSSVNSLKLLNPTTFNTDPFSIEFQLSSDDLFLDPTIINSESDTFATNIVLPNLSEDMRYFLRYRISSPGSSFSGVKSFYNNFNKKFLLIDSLSFANQELNNLSWSNDSIKIIPDTTSISVLSAGWYSGATCVIAKDGVNLLSNTFFAGMGIAVFDNISLAIDTVTWFQLYDQPANVEALANLIDSIPYGKIVAIGVADDARNNLSTHLKDAIKTLGSSLIDSLEFRGSWALIGWKGAPIGSVIEEIKPALPPESIFIDTAFVFQSTSGYFITNEIGPANYWKEIEVNQELPGDASSEYQLSGLRVNGQIDSLRIIDLENGTEDISDIDADLYPKIFFEGKLNVSSDNITPKITRLSVDFIGVPELGTNYQVVSVLNDTVLIGEHANLKFYVYNVGETTADSFKVIVDVINDDNSRSTIFNQSLDSLGAGERQYFEVSHNTSAGSGSKTFLINIDAENKVTELFEDNNFYTIPFFIKPDTTTPSMNITFDGYDILDGDYISDKPLIKTELTDLSLLPITDPSSVEIYLNEVLIPPDTSILSYQFSESNPKVIVEFTPELADGEYILRVLGKNASGNVVDSAGVERYFLVSNEAKILYVYNYPNPFKDATSFTFKLTQIPDEIKIKIFTIAGRLVKEIKLSASQLNFDFNKIYWDGKDEDGDRLANGVYLYKVIMKAGDKTEAVTQKLAIVR